METGIQLAAAAAHALLQLAAADTRRCGSDESEYGSDDDSLSLPRCGRGSAFDGGNLRREHQDRHSDGDVHPSFPLCLRTFHFRPRQG